MSDIIHVIKVPSTVDDMFPYSHFSDAEHEPKFEILFKNDELFLSVRDLFKLKPNNQVNRRNRVDIYMPVETGLFIGEKILNNLGPGELAVLNNINPENFRDGPQTLPVIAEARRVEYKKVQFHIAGFTFEGENSTLYIDAEAPAMEHVEMVGDEIHFGIRFDKVEGEWDKKRIIKRIIPANETKAVNETTPLTKSIGAFLIRIDNNNARNLAATLIHYSQGH